MKATTATNAIVTIGDVYDNEFGDVVRVEGFERIDGKIARAIFGDLCDPWRLGAAVRHHIQL